MDWSRENAHLASDKSVSSASWPEDPWTKSLNELIHVLQAHEADICDAIAATLVLALTASFFVKRPRATGAVVCTWLAWFAWQLARGHSAWQEVLEHAEAAAKSTAGAVRANGEMLVAWVTLVLPAVHDLCRSQRSQVGIRQIMPECLLARASRQHRVPQISWTLNFTDIPLPLSCSLESAPR